MSILKSLFTEASRVFLYVLTLSLIPHLITMNKMDSAYEVSLASFVICRSVVITIHVYDTITAKYCKIKPDS